MGAWWRGTGCGGAIARGPQLGSSEPGAHEVPGTWCSAPSIDPNPDPDKGLQKHKYPGTIQGVVGSHQPHWTHAWGKRDTAFTLINLHLKTKAVYSPTKHSLACLTSLLPGTLVHVK